MSEKKEEDDTIHGWPRVRYISHISDHVTHKGTCFVCFLVGYRVCTCDLFTIVYIRPIHMADGQDE